MTERWAAYGDEDWEVNTFTEQTIEKVQKEKATGDKWEFVRCMQTCEFNPSTEK